MKVYRVENEKHEGPYTAPVACINFAPDARHPLPENDGIMVWALRHLYRDLRFGFRSTEKAELWFSPPERLVLAKHGFRLVQYEVPLRWVKHGLRQTVFDLARAIKRRVLKLEEGNEATSFQS